jgi:hypothetical protein
MYSSMMTTVSAVRHVSATIFGHHQVVLTVTLNSAIPPPLASVYNWGRVVLLFTMQVFTYRLTSTANCFVNKVNGKIIHEGVWGSGCIDPLFLDLGTTWR